MGFPKFSGRLRFQSGRLAWIGLGSVLAFLTVFALWIALTSHAAGNSVRVSSVLSDAYEQARYAVAGEESLERKYRLEPGPTVRARYGASAAALVSALEIARAVGSDDEARLVAEVLQLHDTYLRAIDRMFAAVDAGDSKLVLQIDINETEPIFGKIEALVAAAADSHRNNAINELSNLGQTDNFILAATPVIFLLGSAH